MRLLRLFLKHAVIAAFLVGAFGAALWLLGTQNATVEARVSRCYVHEASGGRGAGGPVVVITFEYVVAGTTYESADLYQPRPPWGHVGWSVEERGMAERFVVEHAPGAKVMVRTSEVFPWAATLVHGSDPLPSQDTMPYWQWLVICGGYVFVVFGRWLAKGFKPRTRR